MKIDRVPMYLQSLTFSTERSKKGEGGGRVRVVCASFVLMPFSRELATKIVPGVVSKIFDARSGEPSPDILDTAVAVHAELSELRLRMATDTEPSVFLPAVRVGERLEVKRDKKTPTYHATFRFNFTYPTAKDLLFLAHALNSQLVVDLSKAQPGLDFEDGADDHVVEFGARDDDEEAAPDGQEPASNFRPLTDAEREAQTARPTARRNPRGAAAH